MRYFNKFLLLITVIAFYSCGPKTQEQDKSEKTEAQASFPERAKKMNIYEVNVRQYTPEGTFNAFAQHLDRLQKMGVDILWFMPIQPIGEKNRKGKLGSYYSIEDYTGVNPHFGTMEDFQNLVKEAHKRNMLVILDWVANHTAWDNKWMAGHQDFYTKDSTGAIIPPNPDWTDVADLNYDNMEMQDSMIQSMKYWVKDADIDGFRCDAAGMVPVSFWNKAKDSLDQVKDLFMLAEWDEPKMHDHAFDMTYDWGFLHTTNEIAKGEKNADSLEAFLQSDYQRYDQKDFRMLFITNHDENSWSGTVKERYGKGMKTFALLAATVEGMPLIYGGQEAGLDKRLRFFDKDTIDWSATPLEGFYTTLLQLKKDNEALWNGAYGARAERINTQSNTANVYAFKRELNGDQVVVITNLSDQPEEVSLDKGSVSGEYTEAFSGKKSTLEDGASFNLKPWEYLVFTQKAK